MDEKDFEFRFDKLSQLNLSNQSDPDTSIPKGMAQSKSAIHIESLSCYKKCWQVLNVLSLFVANTISVQDGQSSKQNGDIIGAAEAKYLLKITKKLTEFMKEYKVSYM